MANDTQQDSGLIRRGLLLLVLVGGIAAVVLWILFQRPTQQTPPSSKQAEPFLASLMASPAGFPAYGSWTDLGMLAETLPSEAGWEVRYNAAASLARLGSPHVNWEVVAEMLDENAQMRNFRVRLESKNLVVPDEAAARRTVLAALRAVKQWHDRQTGSVSPSTGLQRVYQAVEKLATSPVVELKKQAEETRNSINARKAA